MNKTQLIGLLLLLYGIFKITMATLNEIATPEMRARLINTPLIGNVFKHKDSTMARHILNWCFMLYGANTIIHGLYLNRWFIKDKPWIITHNGTYAVHAMIGVFMFGLYYLLFDVNDSFYVIEGMYTGLTFAITVPVLYMYNNLPMKLSVPTAISLGSLIAITYIGHNIMVHNPDRIPNIFDTVSIFVNSFV